MEAKLLALIIALLGAASVFYQAQQPAELTEFQSWKAKFNMKYESMFEQAYRERIFLENLAEIELHNRNEHATYQMGINQFSALTKEQFSQQYLGLVFPQQFIQIDSVDDIYVGDVDWNAQGAVTGVKDQGQCGSCWAFSTTGSLEGLSKIEYGTLESFSEQQLVDCSGSFGNQACNGGLMDNAFKYIKANGILHQNQYPYKAVKQTCSKNAGPFKISGYTDIKNCNDLANAVVGRPVSVAVDATNWSQYKNGVFNNCKTSLDHGVLLVGITDQYWLVKNSWGSTWGQKGYIRVARGNTCGICNMASYPTK